ALCSFSSFFNAVSCLFLLCRQYCFLHALSFFFFFVRCVVCSFLGILLVGITRIFKGPLQRHSSRSKFPEAGYDARITNAKSARVGHSHISATTPCGSRTDCPGGLSRQAS
ncbi:unnamed protein product, partial [Ixodes persulcatus]